MKTYLLIIFTASSIFLTSEAEEFDLPLVLDATGVSACIQVCLSDLFYSAVELVHLQDPVQRFSNVCRKYDEASICVAKEKFCLQSTIFEIALSGIDEVCNERGEDIMQYKDCLETQSEIVLKNCDRECYFTDVLVTLSGKGNAKELQRLQNKTKDLQKELASLCVTFGCMSSCMARDFNINCSPVGTMIVKALLKPFFTFSSIFDEIGPRAKLSVYRQVPPQCYYLVDFQEVEGITFGKPPTKKMSKSPEEAVLNEITRKEEMKKKKKAELEKQFMMDVQKGSLHLVEKNKHR
ncbi:unnamed protein product [Strongylus vulgaris]|uniref:Chondroitin proteoglycan 4 domain-containing protein n=1 Tax=Strongylus vulgaris TaxID=40348 RepID=A0A3P7J2U5_STRVU|nr:unnamed protein product [Strongylus vulgaris]